MAHESNQQHTGISNRETPQEEAREREEFPPADQSPPEPKDTGTQAAEDPLEEPRGV